jgi:hypothetical protein
MLKPLRGAAGGAGRGVKRRRRGAAARGGARADDLHLVQLPVDLLHVLAVGHKLAHDRAVGQRQDLGVLRARGGEAGAAGGSARRARQKRRAGYDLGYAGAPCSRWWCPWLPWPLARASRGLDRLDWVAQANDRRQS